MKNIVKLMFVLSILLVSFSCHDNDSFDNSNFEVSTIGNKSDDNAEVYGNKIEDHLRFDQSVVVIQRGAYQDPNDKEKYFFIIELKNFSEDVGLRDEYNINGLKYVNYGEVTGDNIYTTIDSYKVLNVDEEPGVFNYLIPNVSDSFLYKEKLQEYLFSLENGENPITTYGGRKGKLKLKLGARIGCKMRTITCPEKNWWDSCWPMSSPCTCIEFYDCEFNIEVSFEIETGI